MVRASASGAGGGGFDPGPRHTKDVKNGTKDVKNGISGYLAWRSAFIILKILRATILFSIYRNVKAPKLNPY